MPIRPSVVFDGRAPNEIQALESETRLLLQLGQPGLLQADIVIVIEVVETHHLVSASQQQLRSVEADETGGAGN